jgi:hypothetical protein
MKISSTGAFMTKHMNVKSLIMFAGLLATLLLAGCTVRTSKDPVSGKDKDVDIKTPFGSLSVKKGSTDIKDTGLPLYPGARPRKDGDDNNANVNISSSLFGLKVVATKFESDDASDKVLSFYQKQMGKFGPVIECSGGVDVNFHRHDKDDPVTCEGSGHEYEKALKAGTQHNQHIVAVRSAGKGSTFAVVYVRAWDGKDTI